METGGMATILEFRRHAEIATRSETPTEGRLGEIIIFPGVRIERREEAPGAATPARKRASRARKRQRR
jgi:hypothetical protein